MSNETVISVRNIGKLYKLGATLSHDTLRDKIARGAKSLFSRFRRNDRSPASGTPHPATRPPKELWALRDVSFDVTRGQVVGIIGRNGAGKSTLLKVLSEITEPTEGEVHIHGRVGSLLEVGTGMHPELSGKENVYLNGSILGMRKAEISEKYDEIVEFSEISDFMSTPIKRYSSGMRVRLGFAIAAHLEPEILIIDEVLAVGDLNFQKKCLGKIEDTASAGRTVLFVSHRMDAIRGLCGRTLLLHEGRVIADGETDRTIQEYHRLLREAEVGKHTAAGDREHRRGSGQVRFTHISVADRSGREKFSFDLGEEICLGLSYEVFEPVDCLNVMVALRSGRTMEVVTTSKRHAISGEPLPAGHKGTVRLVLSRPNLRPGEYPLYFGLADNEHQAYDVVDNLTSPLLISTTKTHEELGFDPARPSGYFDIESELEPRASGGD